MADINQTGEVNVPDDAVIDKITTDFNAMFSKKKKKAKAKPAPTADGQNGDKENENKLSAFDYTYTDLLQRVFTIMREKNPNIVAGERKRFVMRPPQVAKVGTKKTSFMNFAEICKLLHRPERHLQQYLLAELGASGSLDGNKALVIKGKFQQKHIENVLVNYIKEYVTCHTCKSPDTCLQKEDRLFFLQCESCGARCSVTSIKTGFQAQVAKRAAARAKVA
ncbi:hypothetical protein GJ496_011848 [Pomphorhynchus laevis]|nr:hypothetical protein GJ496_011848 [Pomphorhynchus laevis]